MIQSHRATRPRLRAVAAALAAVLIAELALDFSRGCRAGEDANMAAIDERLRKTDRPSAPPLDGATAWINAEKPLTLADLKGKIVLLDFWTFG